jgi:pimeloyl-ACP methyl ester carboxylesterase
MDFRWPPPPDPGPRGGEGPGPRAPRTGRPTLPAPPTELIAAGSDLRLEWLATGSGQPVTVFAHGLGNGIAETRPLSSGVPGRKIFFQFRGHGRSSAPPGPWTYHDLAVDLLAVADAAGATQVLGASLGAGALCRLVAERPERFERVAFFLPAVLDAPRPAGARQRLAALLAAVESRDLGSLAEAVAAEIPPAIRNSPMAWGFLRQRLEQLARDGLAPQLASLADEVAVPDRSMLAAVTAPALVIGCLGDDLHPAYVAEQLAAALPKATLHIYDKPGVLWTARTDLRTRIGSFLGR